MKTKRKIPVSGGGKILASRFGRLPTLRSTVKGMMSLAAASILFLYARASYSATVYDVADGNVTIVTPGDYVITGVSSANVVRVSGLIEANVAVSNLSITTVVAGKSPFALSNGAVVNMQLVGTNLFRPEGASRRAGIDVIPGTTLRVTSHSTGNLTVYGGRDSTNTDMTSGNASAAIGGSYNGSSKNSGTVEIHGGTINAFSGGSTAAAIGGAKNGYNGIVRITGGVLNCNSDGVRGTGIGGGNGGSGTSGNAGTIEISGGRIVANGGSAIASSAAGIGNGWKALSGTANITISGGTITAIGGRNGGCGIGGSWRSENTVNVTISGGTITATGGGYERYNSGNLYSGGAAAIGGCKMGKGATVVITGGKISAVGGYDSAAIGGSLQSDGGRVTISGGTVTTSIRSEGRTATVGTAYQNASGSWANTIIGGSLFVANGSAGVTNAATDGSSPVYMVTIPALPPNAPVTLAGLTGYGQTDVIANADGEVYVWLPDGSYEFQAGELTYEAEVAGSDTVALARGLPIAPTIATQPADATMYYGEISGGMTVEAVANAFAEYTLSYQWFTGMGVAVAGATNATMDFVTTLVHGAYDYYVVVTATRVDNGLSASTQSETATLTVLAGTGIYIDGRDVRSSAGATGWVTTNENGTNFVTIYGDGPFVVSGSNVAGVVVCLQVPAGTTNALILSNLYMNVANNQSACCLAVKPYASTTVKLEGESTLYSGYDRAGISVPANAEIIFSEDSTGSVYAKGRGQKGNDLSAGAGIGGDNPGRQNETGFIGDSGHIVIRGGTIYAEGGDGTTAAAIGGGYNGSATLTEISGGIVHASPNENHGAGIGGGNNGGGGTILISGGTTYAHGGVGQSSAAGVGNGWSAMRGRNTDIVVSGGTVYGTGGRHGGCGLGGSWKGSNEVSVTITGGNVMVTGGGSDDVYGTAGLEGGGCGIGGNRVGTGADILITGGVVEAVGGYLCCAIGQSLNSGGGSVTILGGTVVATSYLADEIAEDEINDIGTSLEDETHWLRGLCTNVIVGGSVHNTTDTVSLWPTDGTQMVYRVAFTNQIPDIQVEVFGVPSYYGVNDIWSDSDGVVWLWAPPGVYTNIVIGDKTYEATVESANTNALQISTVEYGRVLLNKESDYPDTDVLWPGDEIRYSIWVSNTGPIICTLMDLYDAIPYGTEYVPDSLEIVEYDATTDEVLLTGAGTFRVPGNVTRLRVEVWGGGGGGGFAPVNGWGGGGAGAAYAHKVLTVTPGQILTYSAGAGGAGGTASSPDGGIGGATWFSSPSVVYAPGGYGGNAGPGPGRSAASSYGSAASAIGDVVYPGGNGSFSCSTHSGPGGGAAGAQGPGINGSGPMGGLGFSPSPGGRGGNGREFFGHGSSGVRYGGGGGGGYASETATRNGGNGAEGIIRLSYAIPDILNDPPQIFENWVMDPGEGIHLAYRVKVNDPPDVLAVTNTATVGARELNGRESDTVVDVIPTSSLSVQKTAAYARMLEGEGNAFTIVVSNKSTTVAQESVRVTDVLPAGFICDSAETDAGSYDAGVGLWRVGTLPPSSARTLTIYVTAAPGTAGSVWTNTATVSCNYYDPEEEDNVSEAVVVVAGANLAVTKTVDLSTPMEGDTVTYDVTVQNPGPDPTTEVVLSDLLPTNGVTYVSHEVTDGNTYNPITGVWTVGNMPVGTVCTLQIKATVDVGTAGYYYTNTASVVHSVAADGNQANNTASAVFRVATLTVDKSSSVDEGLLPVPGNVITYTLLASNVSSYAYSGVTLMDTLPSGLVFVQNSITSSTHTPVGSTPSSLFSGLNMLPHTVAEVSFKARILDPPPTYYLTNNAAVWSTEFPDPVLDRVVDVIPQTDLAITKEESDNQISVGETCDFTIRVTNLSSNETATAVTVQEQLPAGLAYQSHMVEQGTYTAATGDWAIGSIAPGATITLVVTVQAEESSCGQTLVNTASIVSRDQYDPVSANDVATATVAIEGSDLAVVKTSTATDVTETGIFSYSVIVNNYGPNENRGVCITDVLPDGLALLSATTDVGTYNPANGVWNIGSIGQGESPELTLRVRVLSGTADSYITNMASITARDVRDPDPSNDSQNSVVAVYVSPLVLTKDSDVGISAIPGSNITYVISITNKDVYTHTELRLEDSIPDGTHYVMGTLRVIGDETNYWTCASFTNAGAASFTVPEGVHYLVLDAWGGGGGGGYAQAGGSASGGAGGSAAHRVISVVPGQVIPIYVGAGGVGGTSVSPNGTAGGSTWVFSETNCFAEGGAGGAIGTSGGMSLLTAGSSSNSIGDCVFAGGSGSYGSYLASGGGGGVAGRTRVGQSAIGPQGGAGYSSIGSGKGADGIHTPGAGADGDFSGGGGSGAFAMDSAEGYDGGDGGIGLVQITYSSKGLFAGIPYLIDHYTLAPGESVAVTYDVTVDDPVSEELIINTAIVTSTIQSRPIAAVVEDPVLLTELTLRKMAASAVVEEGNTATYRIVVENASETTAAQNVVIEEALPGGLTYSGSDVSVGSFTNGTWTIPVLPAASLATLTLYATADEGSGGCYYTNTATIVSMDTVQTDESDDTASAVILVPGADIGVVKSVNDESPQEGDHLTYTITTVNNGPSDASGVNVSDVLPDGLSFVSASASRGAYDSATGIWNIGSLLNGESVTLNLTANVNNGTLHQSLTNVASVTESSLPDPDESNNTADAVIIVVSYLNVTKTSDTTTPLVPGQSVEYTIVLTNGGTFDYDVLNVFDTLPEELTYEDSTAYCSINGEFPLACNEPPNLYTGLALAAGEYAVFTFSATLEGNLHNISAVTNEASVTSTLFDGDVRARTVNAVQTGDIGVWKTIQTPIIGEDDEGVFRVVVSNLSSVAVSNICVQDIWPTSMRYVGSTLSQGTFDLANQIWTVGTLAAGASATADFTGVGSVGTAGMVFTNTAVLFSADISDTNAANDEASATVKISLVDLVVSKETFTPSPVVGGIASYFIAVQNNGPDDATGIVLNDILPEGLTVSDAYSEMGTYDDLLNVWTIPELVNGAYATLSIDCTVSADVAGRTLTNIVRIVEMDQSDDNEENNEAFATITPIIDLLTLDKAEISTTNAVLPGDTLTYLITATNNNSSVRHNITLTDVVPDSLSLITNTVYLTIPVDVTNASEVVSREMATVIGEEAILRAAHPFTLYPGEDVTFGMQAIVNEDVATDVVTNLARLGCQELPNPLEATAETSIVGLPRIMDHLVTDNYGFTNEVANHSLEDGTTHISFIVYHATGITLDGSYADLLYPDGTPAFTDVVFDDVASTNYNGLPCQILYLPEPRIYPAWDGMYLHRLTIASSNGWVLNAVTSYYSSADSTVAVPISFKAWDDDIASPAAPDTLYVNNEPMDVPTTAGLSKRARTEELRSRMTWTRDPEFYIQFGTPSEDSEPTSYAHPLETSVRGVGSYHLSARADINDLTPTERALEGTAYPTVVHEGALADRSFEFPEYHAWLFSGAYSYESRNANPAYVYSEASALRLMSSASAVQTFALEETVASEVCSVSYSGWYRGGPATVCIKSYPADSSSSAATVIYTNNLPYVASWTAFSRTDIAIGSASREAFDMILTANEGATVWFDLLDAAAEIGANRSTFRYIANASSQGATLGLFSVDDDYDHPYDRLASEAADVFIPYDITPPIPVDLGGGGQGAEGRHVDDSTTELRLDWLNASEMGPDNPSANEHPTKNSADIDLLSPWKSYRVYVSPYSAAEVPADDDRFSAASYIYTNFVANNVYTSWPSIDASLTNSHSELAEVSTSGTLINDLEYAQDYAFVVVGIDEAGNESRPTINSWATNSTDRFVVTQGLLRTRAYVTNAFGTNHNMRADDETTAALYWKAAGVTNTADGGFAVSKDYDLIYWDDKNFNETTSNVWNRVSTIHSNWFTDVEGMRLSDQTLRFYRASYKDRWQRHDPSSGAKRRPLASQEVYSMNNVVLSEGFNYVSLQGLPYTNTFAAVFGTATNFWPSAESPAAGATTIEFYYPGATHIEVSDFYFFGSDGRWYDSSANDVTDVEQATNFFTRAFSINLPNPLPDYFTTTTAYYREYEGGTPLRAMIWHPILQVPTNAPGGSPVFSHEIRTGNYTRTNDLVIYNPIALNLPVSTHPSNLNLIASGFGCSSDRPGISDSLYVIDSTTKAHRGSTADGSNGGTIFCDTSHTWRFCDTLREVPNDFIHPNDMIVIISRSHPTDGRAASSNTWIWTYSPSNFYTYPTRNMGE